MKFDSRTVEAVADALASQHGMQEGGLYPGGPNVEREIDRSLRHITGSRTRDEVEGILDSYKRGPFIIAVRKKLKGVYGAGS